MCSIGKLHFDSSISELRYLASKTIFSDSNFARMITRLIKELPFGCSSLFTGEIISYCSKMSSNLFTLSCKWIGTLLALSFLKTASGFNGRCSDELIFPRLNLMMLRRLLNILTVVLLIYQIQFVYFVNVRN